MFYDNNNNLKKNCFQKWFSPSPLQHEQRLLPGTFNYFCLFYEEIMIEI